ncbi:hypothetical protein [Desulfobacula toluolica]|uniref:hypothetical protein n=1 Tax=Desulfobacula toluolica TaxID=28223 RepID=UPI00059E8B34|nr:hypothetical protein [Desulfobacula toluolica]
MNHKESYVGTAMVVWFITSIVGFIDSGGCDVRFFSLKFLFFLLGGVFILSSIFGYIFTMLFGYATSIVLKNSELVSFDPERENIALILKIGKIIK